MFDIGRPSLLNRLGTDVQLGFTVRDMDKALSYWRNALGSPPFVVIEHILQGAVLEYKGRPVDVALTAAFTYQGDTMVELLCQSGDEPSPYVDSPHGLHHFGVWPEDQPGTVEELRSAGFIEIATIGRPGDPTPVRYMQSADIGVTLELIPRSASRTAFYSAIQRFRRTQTDNRHFPTIADFMAFMEGEGR